MEGILFSSPQAHWWTYPPRNWYPFIGIKRRLLFIDAKQFFFSASTRLFFSTSTSSSFRARTVACSFEDGGKIAPSHTFLPPWCWVMGRLSTFIPLLAALNSSQHAQMTVLTDPTCSRTSPFSDLRGGGSLFCWPAAPATGATLRASPTTSCHSAENVEKAEDTKRETPTSEAAEMFVSLVFSL